MKTHNRKLFHCLHCGRVVRTGLLSLAPNCCGKRMVNAATETVDEAGRPVLHDVDAQDEFVSGRNYFTSNTGQGHSTETR